MSEFNVDRANHLLRRVFADLITILLGTSLGILVLVPGLMKEILSEDGPVEIPTAVFAAVGAAFALAAIPRCIDAQKLRNKSILLALLCVVIVGEENDWGLRLFIDGKNNIKSVNGDSIDINVNSLHEIVFEVGPREDAPVLWKQIAIMIVSVACILLIAGFLSGGLRIWPLNAVVWDRAQRLTLAGMLLIIIAQAYDALSLPSIGMPKETYRLVQKAMPGETRMGEKLHIDDTYPDPRYWGHTLGPRFPEEVLELFASVFFCFAGWSLYLRARGFDEPPQPAEHRLWPMLNWYLTAAGVEGEAKENVMVNGQETRARG